jgi:hypothetical protein
MSVFRIPRNHTEIHYEYLCTSTRTEETIVLLHGNGLDSRIWYKIIDGLLEYFNVLIYDFPGHGESPLKTCLPSWEELCEDLKLLMEFLDIRYGHLVGHGIGGSFAVKFVNVYPSTIKTLSLISTLLCFPTEGVREYVAYIKKQVAQFGQKGIVNYLVPKLTIFEETTEERKLIQNSYESVDLDMHYHFYKLIIETNWRTEIKQINKPVLLLAGALDDIYTPYSSLITSSLLSKSSFINIPNASNMVFIDQPEESKARMIDFIITSTDDSLERINSPFNITYYQNKMKNDFLIMHQTDITPYEISFKVIGQFSVSINDVPIEAGWNRRLAKNIFLYLSFYRMVTREKLIDVFWPEIDIKSAKNQLRVSLNNLKSILQAAGFNNIIKSDSEYIFIDAIVHCDINQLYLLLNISDHVKQRVVLEEQVLNNVSCIVAGNYLIGFYDDWSTQLKRDIETLFIDSAHHLASLYETEGERMKSFVFKNIVNKFENDEENQKDHYGDI